MQVRKLFVSASALPTLGLAGLATSASAQNRLTCKFGVLASTADFPGTIGMEMIKAVQDTP